MKSRKYHLFNLNRKEKLSKKMHGIIINKKYLSNIKIDNGIVIIPKNIHFYYFEDIKISPFQENFSIIKSVNGKLHLLQEYSFCNTEFPNEIKNMYAFKYLQKELEQLEDDDIELTIDTAYREGESLYDLTYRIYNKMSSDKHIEYKHFIDEFYTNSDYIVLDNFNIKEYV